MKKITREHFDKYVGVNNPHNKGVYYAFITWNGYDFSEAGSNTDEAINNLWAYLDK